MLWGYWVHIRPFPQMWKRTGLTCFQTVYLQHPNGSKPPACMHAAAKRSFHSVRIMGYTLSWWQLGPTGTVIADLSVHKELRAWEGEPVQTTGPHPSLTALFNELAADQRIPQPVRTGLSGLSGKEPKPLNWGQRSSETPLQCFLWLQELTRFVPHRV